MNGNDASELQIKIESVVVRFETRIFEEFERIREGRGISEDEMVNQVCVYGGELAEKYSEWLQGE